jgi:hypothetical protein
MALRKKFKDMVECKIDLLEQSIKEVNFQLEKIKKQQEIDEKNKNKEILLDMLGLYEVKEEVSTVYNASMPYQKIEVIKIYDDITDEDYEYLLDISNKITKLEIELNNVEMELKDIEG